MLNVLLINDSQMSLFLLKHFIITLQTKLIIIIIIISIIIIIGLIKLLYKTIAIIYNYQNLLVTVENIFI